ncbi:MAG: type I methionyl aminopeptidase [Parcubacteria group bacterium]|jgi:methionyl aminopeptidase|nr:type I methionyl aminopeptidase [Parcubacteria group bacterium]|tara:strand:- start:13680 stop:14456 length:777 start_codon:yes stop_codon:yes gene_type:complete
MNTIKKPEEVQTIRQGGKILANILAQLVDKAKPGVRTIELDELAEKLILESGGIPAFKHYHDKPEDTPYPCTICASVNHQLVHTPASNYELKEGDILSIDIGMKYPKEGGLFTDMAVTIPIGKIPESTQKLLDVTRESLVKGIAQVKPGNYISDISKAVQNYVEPFGFSIVRQLVGHGVGYQVHEEPRVPNYFNSKQPVVELKEGMVIAIEPMVNVGDPAVKTDSDGLTIVPVDGRLCAHFEHTVAVTKDGFQILTDK